MGDTELQLRLDEAIPGEKGMKGAGEDVGV